MSRWVVWTLGGCAIALILAGGIWQLTRGNEGEGVDPASLVEAPASTRQIGLDAARGIAYDFDRTGRVRLTLTGNDAVVRQVLGRSATLTCTREQGGSREVDFIWPRRVTVADLRLPGAYPARVCTLQNGSITSRALLSSVRAEPGPGEIDSPRPGDPARPARP